MLNNTANWRYLISFTTLTLIFGFAGAATAQQVDEQVDPVQDEAAPALLPSEVVIPRSAHFSAPDGTDVQVPAGIYVVELAPDAELRLVPRDGDPIVVNAEQTEHEEQLDGAFALSEEAGENEFHIVLLLPGAIAHDAVASYSGIVTRDTRRRILSTTQISRARTRYKRPPTSLAAQSGAPAGAKAFTTEAQRLPTAVKYSWPTTSSGVFSGTYNIPSARSSTGDYFNFEYIVTIGVWKLSKDYGAKIKWEFISDGAIAYNYSVPFKVHFQFPQSVRRGQRIFLDSTFTWGNWNPRSVHRPGNPSMQTTQDYRYSHKTSVWVDAPDGLGATATNFTQEAARARVYVKIPVLPLAPSIEGGFDCTIWPCNQGGGDYGGSYTKLGGAGRLTNSIDGSYEESDTTISLIGSGTVAHAWRQGHEQFELVATVLGLIPTPVTVAAGAGIELIRRVGGFRLYTELDGDILRTDIIRLEILSQPYVDVPTDLQGDVWGFDVPVKVRYRTKFESWFSYPLGYNVTFDMAGIGPQELTGQTLLNVPGGKSISNWIEREAVFNTEGAIPVGQLLSQVPVQTTTTQPSLLTNRTLSLPPVLTNTRVASIRDTQRLIRKAESRSFPRPATPRSGQYTVVTGRHPETQARRIIAELAAREVQAIALPVRGSTDRIISCGSFASESEAKLLSSLLKEMLNIESVVTTNPYEYRPAATKLQLPSRTRP
jgi:hypothetical protein